MEPPIPDSSLMNLLGSVSPIAEYKPLSYVTSIVLALAVAGALVATVRSRKSASIAKRGWLVAKGAISWVFIGMASILLVAGGLSAYGTKVDKWRTAPILSGSMSPGLDKGDVAIVRPSTAEATRVGDVIIFKAPKQSGIVQVGDPVIHRVIEIMDPTELNNPESGAVYVQTQGDNNPKPDNWIVKLDEDIVWQQTVTVRDIGEGFLLIARPRARAGLLIGAMILFAGTAIAQWISTESDNEPSSDSDSDDQEPEPEPEPRDGQKELESNSF